MKSLCLLVVGAVVGWAVSGVDWSREAVGEEASKTASKSTDGVLTFELSDKPVDRPVADGVQQNPGNPDDLDPFRQPAMKFSEPLIDAPPSTLQQDVPDAPPQPTVRAVPANPRKADGIFQEGPNPRQRSVSYDHIKPAETSGGQPHSSPPTDVVERRVTDGNGRTMAILENRIQQHSTPSGLVGRFQATAYGSPNGHGCFVVETVT